MTIPVFPSLVGVTYPVGRSPNWNTDIQRTVTGKRTALANFSYPIWAYELSYDVLRSDITNLEWQTLLAFYNLNYGPANVWQFTDPDDGSVTAQAFGQGDGVTTAFQLVRTMQGLASNQFVEPVWAPTGTPSISVAGVHVTALTISATGLVTFNVAPANGAALTWTGTFNWLCRFDGDKMDFSKFAKNFWDAKKITFSTEKL